VVNGVWEFADYTYKALDRPGAVITSPHPSLPLTASPTQTFTWTNVGASLYQLWIGTTPGSYDLGFYPPAGTTATSVTVENLPTDGRTLYVRLYSAIGGVWRFTDWVYTTFPMLTSPTLTLTWASNVTDRWLQVGTSLFGGDIFSQGNMGPGTSHTISGFRMNSNIYVDQRAVVGGFQTFQFKVYSTHLNVALAAMGATAAVSSQEIGDYPASALIDGDRGGGRHGLGGTWIDGTPEVFPDWATVTFATPRIIDRVVVYSMWESGVGGTEPSDTHTYSNLGASSFTVETLHQGTWTQVANVTGNNLVKRAVPFSPRLAEAVRVNVQASPSGKSQLMEIEAWHPQPAGCPAPPATVTNFDLTTGFSHNLALMRPGQVTSALLPVYSDGRATRDLSMVPSPRTSSPATASVDITISRCPGEISTTPSACVLTGLSPTLWNVTWLQALVSPYTSKLAAEISGICPALASEGPWYVNVRHQVPDGCPSGAESCGYIFQWY
jgi:hypothetical protein